ncbi:MAG: hypothetical protein GYA50_06045 [Eubacteriaceae bacterium]|nr:hypothetical protein [Eubacteriaceae bacterium]
MYSQLEHIFILNSSAISQKKQDKLKEQIFSACKDEDIKKEIFISKQKGDIEGFIAGVLQHGRKARFYACGGDGTLNIVANCIYGHEGCELAAIPFGTGNDFIKSFTNTGNFSDIEKQIKGEAVKVDCISFDNKIAVNMINIGFDSAVAGKTEEIKKIPSIKGPMAYIVGVAVILKQMPLTQMEIIIDGKEKLSGRFLLCAISSGSYCGGGFNALSKAVLNDGLIDIVAVMPLSRLKFISIVGKYKKGTLLGTELADKILTFRQCKTVSVKLDREDYMCVDGEMLLTGGDEFKAVNKAVMFSVPHGCEQKNK